MFTELKDKLIRKLAQSFLLKFLDGRKTEVARLAQAINMLIAALYLSLPVLDAQFGTELAKNLDFVNDKWLLATAFLTSLGLELGIADGEAKKRIANQTQSPKK